MMGEGRPLVCQMSDFIVLTVIGCKATYFKCNAVCLCSVWNVFFFLTGPNEGLWLGLTLSGLSA